MDFFLGRQHPRPFSNYMQARQERHDGRIELKSKPSYLRFEITTRCNMLCLFCMIRTYALAGRDMDLKILRKASKDLLPWAASVQYADQGEPLIYRHIRYVLKQIQKVKPPRSKIFTNGKALEKRIIRRIIRSGLSELAVSIDGATPETYESIRRGASFNQLMENLGCLANMKKDSRSETPMLTVATVAMRDNVHQIGELVAIAHRFGAKMMAISKLFSIGQETDLQAVDLKSDEVRRALSDAFALADRQGIAVRLNIPDFVIPVESSEVPDDRFYAGSIAVPASPARCRMDSPCRIAIEITNHSPFTWFPVRSATSSSAVSLAYHLYNDRNEMIRFDGIRSQLPHPIRSGESVRMECLVAVSENPGPYTIEFDLVNEGHRWFGIDSRLAIEVIEEVQLDAAPQDHEHCQYPWMYLSVKVNGDCRLCRFSSISIGNLTTQSIGEVWNSPTSQLLRRTILDGSYALCIGACCSYVEEKNRCVRAELVTRNIQPEQQSGGDVCFEIQVTNTGSVPWLSPPPGSADPTFYALSYHILTDAGEPVRYDGDRFRLPPEFHPGESVRIMVDIGLPERPGDYVIVFDIVREQVTWFESLGNPVSRVPVRVEA